MKPRSATVIVGANFGDEGKGLAVDAIVGSNPDAAVIRFNGGAQAGHTVVTADGRRHVFSHFGAGSFAGAATFLSRFFVVQPQIFAGESAELAGIGVTPSVYIDPEARVTTPFDVLVNRWVEELRAGGRHGSVGVGFGETIERAGRGYPLAVRDLGDDVSLTQALAAIRDAWLPARLAELGVPFTAERRRAAADPAVIGRYLAEIDVLRERATPAPVDAVLGRERLVFEGAQGLLLDMDRGSTFPYLTRSSTGIRNALAVAADAGIGRLDVCYMTRAYLTRHGAGPLANEVPRLAFAEVVDPTNQPNPWQGVMRLAPLDLDLLRTTIAADLGDAAGAGIAVDAGIGVTCLDQVHACAEVVRSGVTTTIPRSRLATEIAAAVGLPLVLEAHGPTRTTVELAGHRAVPGRRIRARMPAGLGRCPPNQGCHAGREFAPWG